MQLANDPGSQEASSGAQGWVQLIQNTLVKTQIFRKVFWQTFKKNGGMTNPTSYEWNLNPCKWKF